jgi:hypothetical protein
MANSERAYGDEFPDTPFPTDDEIGTLLDTLEEPPADEAEEQVIRSFKARLAGGRGRGTPATPPFPALRGSFSRRDSRFPDRHFRPNLEDLGPRDLSSFPLAATAVAAGLAGAPSMAILGTGSPVVVPVALGRQGTHTAFSPPEQAHLPAGSVARGDIDTQVLDRYFSSCPPPSWGASPEPALAPQVETLPEEFLADVSRFNAETPSILPSLGAVLLLGGLRQDRERSPLQLV